MTKQKYIFEVEVETEIYEILKKYDYYFEENIKQKITEDGKELLKALKKCKEIMNEGGETND